MSQAREHTNRSMLRVRDTLDRDFDQDLDIESLARLVHLSADHLIRTSDVTEVCVAVGFSSLGSFSRLFSSLVGEPPSSYAWRQAGPAQAVPGGFMMAWTRPSSGSRSAPTPTSASCAG